jgi:three-Cys-motif partner protein
MSQVTRLKFDEVGSWSEVKLDIIREYAAAYSRILAAQRDPTLYHVYIDAFAGPGIAISRATGEFIPGSPLNALGVYPPFREYHLIDLDSDKIASLRAAVGDQPNVRIYPGDCNEILLKEVFPKVQFKDYRRGLCLLDPYGLHLNWEVVRAAGQMRTLDMFLNFPVADINRNVLWRQPEGVDPRDLDRMNAFWGDDSWKSIAYTTDLNLFGYEEKTDNETVAEGFRARLKNIAGFENVPSPLPMRNSKGTVIYYLFFASQKPVAQHIVDDIFSKYRGKAA